MPPVTARSTGDLKPDRGQFGQQQRDKLSIPLLARASHQGLDRFLWIASSPVGPVARQRVIRVADRHNPCQERNLVATQSIWVTTAIESLMVMANNGQGVRDGRQ